MLAGLSLGLFVFMADGRVDEIVVSAGLVLLAIWGGWCLAVVVYRRYQFRRQLREYSFFRSVDEGNE